jgi:hypothetical protein
VVDGSVTHSESDVGGQGYSNFSTLPPNYNAGGGLYIYNAIPGDYITGGYFAGGWEGLHISGGYDYVLSSVGGKGANAAMALYGVNATISGTARYDCGVQAIFVGDSNIYGDDWIIKSANFNDAGMTTDSVLHISGSGQFGHVFKFGGLETDFEDGGNPGCPIVHIDLIRDIPLPVSSTYSFKNIITNNLRTTSPIFLLTGSQNLDPTQGTPNNVVWIDKITLSDGFDVSVDSANWQVFVKDSTTTPDAELVRYAGPGPNPQGNVEYVKTVAALPSAGRFQAGSIRLKIWPATAGNPAEYVCTSSGTAAWSSGYKYLANPSGPFIVGPYVQDGGTEYKCIFNNANLQPSVSVKSITNASGATPIRITAANHGIVSSQFVVVAGVGGNTNANGTWTGVRIDANTFDIYGPNMTPVGPDAAYTSGGTASPFWAATGRTGVSAPVWKAVSTVAP